MTFEYILDVPANLTSEGQLVEFTQGLLNAFQAENSTRGKSAQIPLGLYTDLSWNPNPGFQDKQVQSLGFKMLPGAGGFYYANFKDETHVIAHMNEPKS